MVKAPINSRCPNPLACIRWLPPTLSLFGKNAFPTKHIFKSGLGWIPNLGSFPSPPNYSLCISSVVGLTSIALVGLQYGKAPPSLATFVSFLILASFFFMQFLPRLFVAIFCFFSSFFSKGISLLFLFIRALWASWACFPSLGFWPIGCYFLVFKQSYRRAFSDFALLSQPLGHSQPCLLF